MEVVSVNAVVENIEERYCARCQYISSSECDNCIVREIIYEIEYTRTLKTTNIVHCSNCMHRTSRYARLEDFDSKLCITYHCTKLRRQVDPMDFCSFGKQMGVEIEPICVIQE